MDGDNRVSARRELTVEGNIMAPLFLTPMTIICNFQEGGLRGVRKPQNRAKVCQITANRTEFYQKTEIADTNEVNRKSPLS